MVVLEIIWLFSHLLRLKSLLFCVRWWMQRGSFCWVFFSVLKFFFCHIWCFWSVNLSFSLVCLLYNLLSCWLYWGIEISFVSQFELKLSQSMCSSQILELWKRACIKAKTRAMKMKHEHDLQCFGRWENQNPRRKKWCNWFLSVLMVFILSSLKWMVSVDTWTQSSLKSGDFVQV